MIDDKQLEERRRNYRAMHSGTAKSKGVYQEFISARTLTEMRKILWGYKKKHRKASK
jgi:hypothetical protein